MATWANTTLCEVSDVQEYFGDVHHLMGRETNDPTLNSEITKKITAIKRDVIRPAVLELARIAFPNTADALLRFGRAKHRQYLSHVQANEQQAGTGSLLSSGADDFSYDSFFNSNIGALKPRIWFSDGTPIVTTNTAALNGDFCLDTTNWLVYLNRSITSTPDWDQWRTEDAHDYIYNPSELKRWTVFEVVKACLIDRAFRNFITSERDQTALEELLNTVTKEITGYKIGNEVIPGARQNALSLLRFDITNDGVLSEYENESTGDVFLGFA